MVEFGIRYGLTSDLTIGLIPKYFKRKVQLNLDEVLGGTVNADVEGWGDTVALVKYHIWGQRKVHLSMYGLLSIPTGSTKVRGGNDEVWRWIPLGSGSYDFAPGLAFTAGMESVIFHSNMHYLFTDGEEVGDEFRFNLGFVQPLGGTAFFSLGLNYRWRDEIERSQHLVVMNLRPDFIGPSFAPIPAGPVIVDTDYTEPGGHTLFISPALKFDVLKGWKFEIGIQIPLLRSDEGWAEDIVLHVGISKTLF